MSFWSGWRLTTVMAVVTFQIACAPVERVEWDVQRGRLIDTETGYFAYYVGTRKSPSERVCVHVADRNQLEGKVVVAGLDDTSHTFYPAVPYVDDVALIPPMDVAELIVSCTSPRHGHEDAFEIGYFAKTIYGADLFQDVDDDSSSFDGVTWRVLTNDGRRKVVDVLKKIRARAAEEGAMAVRGVAVSCAGGGSLAADRESKQESLTIIGRALVFGEVQMSEGIRHLIRVPLQ